MVVLNTEELGAVGATAALSVAPTGVLLVPAIGVWLVARQLGGRNRFRTAGAELARVG